MPHVDSPLDSSRDTVIQHMPAEKFRSLLKAFKDVNLFDYLMQDQLERVSRKSKGEGSVTRYRITFSSLPIINITPPDGEQFSGEVESFDLIRNSVGTPQNLVLHTRQSPRGSLFDISYTVGTERGEYTFTLSSIRKMGSGSTGMEEVRVEDSGIPPEAIDVTRRNPSLDQQQQPKIFVAPPNEAAKGEKPQLRRAMDKAKNFFFKLALDRKRRQALDCLSRSEDIGFDPKQSLVGYIQSVRYEEDGVILRLRLDHNNFLPSVILRYSGEVIICNEIRFIFARGSELTEIEIKGTYTGSNNGWSGSFSVVKENGGEYQAKLMSSEVVERALTG